MSIKSKGCIGTYSCDAGSIKVVADTLTLRIPNGVGDGEYRVILLDDIISFVELLKSNTIPGESVNPFSYYWGEISGKSIEIHDYDCNDSGILIELRGDYLIFVNSGDVVFVKEDYSND